MFIVLFFWEYHSQKLNLQHKPCRWLIKEKERSKAAGGPRRLLAASRDRAYGILEALETFGFK